MRLKYRREVRKKRVTLEVEAVSFTKEELDALERLGGPEIKMEGLYGNNHGISVDRRMGPNFKLKIRLDGSDGIEDAVEATSEFLEDLELEVEKKMGELIDKDYNIKDEVENEEGYIDINI